MYWLMNYSNLSFVEIMDNKLISFINDTHHYVFFYYYEYAYNLDYFLIQIESFIGKFCTIFSTGFIGFMLSFLFVAYFVYKPLIIQSAEVKFIFEDIIEYEYKYVEEFDELDELDNDKDIRDGCLEGAYVEEDTPAGKVLLFYDVDNERFLYYSKRRDMPYRYLETVSRRFACVYNCKAIYIDYIKEYNKAKEKLEDAKEAAALESAAEATEWSKIITEREEEKGIKETQSKEAKALDSVFATYKKHKTVGVSGGKKGEETNKTESKTKKIPIITEKCNKYIYKGSIDDYEKEKEKEKDARIEEDVKLGNIEENISFSEFKKRKLA